MHPGRDTHPLCVPPHCFMSQGKLVALKLDMRGSRKKAPAKDGSRTLKKTLRAQDVMRKELITVREDEDVWSVAWTLTQHRITGAPVLDDRGRLVGVVSQTDLARYLWNRQDASLAPATAGQLMTRRLIRAAPEAPLSDLAGTMTRHGVHRVLITRGSRLLGLVTTMDLIAAETKGGKKT